MKKLITKKFVTILMIIVLIVIATVASFGLERIKKLFEQTEITKGKYLIVGNEKISVPTIQDKKIAEKNIIEKGIQELNLQTNLVDKTKEKDKVSIDFTIGNKTETVVFEYFEKNLDKYILYSYNYKNYVSHKLEKTKNKYMVEFKSNIYLVDLEEKKSYKILKDESNGYLKDVLQKKANSIEGLTLSWGENVFIHPNNDKFAFITNRKAVSEEKGNHEVWIKDLSNENEYSLGEIGYKFLGWYEENLIMQTFDGSIVEINIVSKEISLLYSESFNCQLVNCYLIIPQTDNIKIINIINKSERNILIDSDSIFNISVNEDKKYISFLNRPDDYKEDVNMCTLNLETAEVQEISPPTNYKINNCYWLNREEMLVNLFNKDGEYSSVITLSEIYSK